MFQRTATLCNCSSILYNANISHFFQTYKASKFATINSSNLEVHFWINCVHTYTLCLKKRINFKTVQAGRRLVRSL